MTDVIVTTTTSTGVILSGAVNRYFLAEGVTHYSTASDGTVFIDPAGSAVALATDIFVNGTLANIASTVIQQSNGSDAFNTTVTIGSSGRVMADPQLFAIILSTRGAFVVNNGEVSGAAAVSVIGDASRVHNNGVMVGSYAFSTNLFTVDFGGSNVEFVNTGTVLGRNGVEFNGNGSAVNSGTITATFTAILSALSSSEALDFSNTGTITGGTYVFEGRLGADKVRNSGTLNGELDLDGGDNLLRNDGIITGDVSAESGADRIVNTGTINGDLETGSGEDTVSITGTVAGNVDLGSNNDVLNMGSLGVVSGAVDGGFGDDSLYGGDLGDDLRGEEGADFIVGRAGDDTLSGGLGDDTVLGGSGADNLQGVAGSNVLNGQDGNDVLVAGIGNNRMFGGNGDDTLTANEGNDILRGDAGNDVFVFQSVFDTGTGSTRDRILGWEDGADKIDLTGFGPVLTFSATGPTGSGTGTVWFDAVSGGTQTMLRIDLDGDGTFDGQVLLVRADPALFDQSDLILA
ncbi:MAG: calcium-binding protein [Pseudomonadota bacterium]